MTAASLPPRRVSLEPRADGSVAGVIHVHTDRSDGRNAPEDVAAIAARAGLTFLVFTDHGDATRPPDAPVYRSGVLCIDGVEISTSAGHYVAIGLPASPYPLGGEARDVAEDVARLGGFGVAAHPDSPKAELRWGDWAVPVDGIELLNPDTSWRTLVQDGWRSRFRLFQGLFTYPFRSPETIAGLLTDPQENLTRWNALTERRKVVGLAGTDAHAKLALMDIASGDNRYTLPLPGYEASLRTLSVHVRPGGPLTGDAATDAAAILSGLRAGHTYVAVDGLATPASFEFTAERAGNLVAQGGDDMPAGEPVTLRVRSNAPATFMATIWQGSTALKSGPPAELTADVGAQPAVYRADIRTPGGRTWLFSNPIYVRGSSSTDARPARSAGQSAFTLFDGRASAAEWRTEADLVSSAEFRVAPVPAAPLGPRSDSVEIELTYRLAGVQATPPHAALLAQTSQAVPDSDRLAFTARADRPMRVSVQLRTGPSSGPEERWQRSVYLDATTRDYVVSFDEMTPVGQTRTAQPALAEIRDVIFAVDRTNAQPGASGQVWIGRVAFER